MNPPIWQSVSTAAIGIGQQSLTQFICFFGLLLMSGFLLTWISRWTNNSFRQFHFPKMGLYLFGAIGVPLHEFCHALFANIFFHRIESIKWFDPKGKNGSAGVVVHTYSDKNLYHRVGLFFIGMGPVLLAPFLIYLLYTFLVPGALHISLGVAAPSLTLDKFAQSLVAAQNWSSVGFYVFIYTCICLTSQMELSNEDFTIARGGIFPLFSILVIINSIAYAFSFNVQVQLRLIFTKFIYIWGSFFLFALAVSLLNMVICFLVLNLIQLLLGRDSINPFRTD